MKFHIGAICILVMWCNVTGLYYEKTNKTFQLPDLPKSALFGFSISYQAKIKRLLISAPKSNLAGAIYSCEIGNQVCSQTTVDLTGGLNRTNMWFGAHVSSNDNLSVACAPRFVENIGKTGTFSRCFFSKDGNSFTKMKSLPVDFNLTSFELNMNSFGWSIHIDKHGNILIGGPVMSTGRVNMYTSTQLSSEPTPLEFQKGANWNINYNFGYSITSGLFTKSANEDNIIYAISSTYGECGIGQVILTDGKTAWPLDSPREYAPPVGSMFGASMCSAKLQVSGQHDALLIGAPTYAEKPLATGDYAVNLGAVYIYQYDLKQKRMVHHKTILGTKEEGQFGSTVIDLGDLNGDKRSEIAISAPYEDGGAVYIYSAADLLSDVPANMIKWLQKIQPSGYKTFGLSLVALQDYDNNGCNELAIGAPDSNQVVLLQCTAKIIVNVRYLEEYVTSEYPRAKRNDTYFLFQSCFDVIFPEKPEVVKADIRVTVSITHPTASLANFKSNSMSYSVSIRDKKKKTFCKEVGIIMPLNNIPVIQYKVSAVQTVNPLEDSKFDAHHAIVSGLSTLSLSSNVWVADCTDKRECNPQLDFDINSSIKNDYLIGSSEMETVNVSVHNTGVDVAYSACAHVMVSGVRVRHWQPDCALVDDVIVCAPKQPIRVDQNWSTGNIVLEMNRLKSDATKITFTVKLFPNCHQTKNSQEKNKTFTLRPDPTGMLIKGSTILGDDVFITSTELKETGKPVMHTYTVFNGGKTAWVDLACEIMWENKPFYHGAVMVDTTESYKCMVKPSGNKEKNKTTCIISELKSNRKFDVIIRFFIEPGKLDAKLIEKENMKISTEIDLSFGKNVLKQKVSSSLKNTTGVPLWIIIVSVLVGLLIIVITTFILYEFGFLRRKNKEKLQNLKKNVYRQSMRRSMAIRESMRAAHAQSNRTSEDLEKLMENPSEPADCEDIRKELIILGLQKNIGLGGSKSKPVRRQASPSPTEKKAV